MSVASCTAAISLSVSSRASTICENPQSARNFAFSGVRVSHCVLACSAIGGSSILSRAMSCTIRASAPARYRSCTRRSTLLVSSSYIMVFTVTYSLAPYWWAYSATRRMSSMLLAAAERAPWLLAPIYTASAPWSIAAMAVSASRAGDSNSNVRIRICLANCPSVGWRVRAILPPVCCPDCRPDNSSQV